MSKERELLERLLVSGIFESGLYEDWEQYIKELLAQPEHINFDLERMKLAVESPVSDITGEELMKQVKTNRVFYQEGYAQAELDLKREPLGLEIIDFCGSEDYREGFKDGALYSEKCHGIGGGE